MTPAAVAVTAARWVRMWLVHLLRRETAHDRRLAAMLAVCLVYVCAWAWIRWAGQ